MFEEITGSRGFHPASETYVVKDLYELDSDGYLEFGISGERHKFGLNSASFTLIRAFELSNADAKTAITPRKVLIEGKFEVELPDVKTLNPKGYTNVGPNWNPQSPQIFNAENLLDLDRVLPTIEIQGKFKHSETKRRYDVTIPNAFVTQDLPWLLFRQPLGSCHYTFIAAHAIIDMLHREDESRAKRSDG